MTELQTQLEGISFEIAKLHELSQLYPNELVVMRTLMACANIDEHIAWITAYVGAEALVERCMRASA